MSTTESIDPKTNELQKLDEILTAIRALAGQQSGWASMAQNIREYDEDRIKDVKDDIDNLFIFVRGLLGS
jgi:hypothetical protein